MSIKVTITLTFTEDAAAIAAETFTKDGNVAGLAQGLADELVSHIDWEDNGGSPETVTAAIEGLPVADITVEDQGTLVLFRPRDAKVRDILAGLVESEAQWFGDALVVEHRFAGDLADVLQAEHGLTVTTELQ